MKKLDIRKNTENSEKKFGKILWKIRKNCCEKIGDTEKHQKFRNIPKIWKNTQKIRKNIFEDLCFRFHISFGRKIRKKY